MRKKNNNITITGSFLRIAIIGIIASVIIGVFGYTGIRKVNNNVSKMYDERVQPLGISAGIRGEFSNVRIEMHKNIIKYDSKRDENINANYDKINSYLEEYSAINLDDEEIKQLNIFKSNYE